MLSLSYLYYLQFRMKVRIPFQNLGILLAIGGLFTGVFWGLSLTSLPWWLVSGIAGVFLLGLTYMSGMIKLREDA
jgi:hypothetical protein